jgi:uncharacterized protein YecA (UPF0149 family)
MSIFELSLKFLRLNHRRKEILAQSDRIWNERTKTLARFSEQIHQKKFYDLNDIQERSRPLVKKLHAIMDRIFVNAHKLDETRSANRTS